MMGHSSTMIYLIIVTTFIVMSSTIDGTETKNKRLANPELPPQPLHDQNAAAATSSLYNDIYSDKIEITTSFPGPPTMQGCIVKISLVGRGIKDSYRGRCWIGGAFSLNTDDVMMWGDPDKTPISFYSDEPGTLVVIINHVCTMKKYSSKNGKQVVSINHMSQERCTEVIDTIHAHMEDYDLSSAPPTVIHGIAVNAKDGVKNDHYTSSKLQSVLDGECQKTVVVKGRGIADSITVPCSSIKDSQLVKFKGGMLIGNPMKDGFSMFSEEWGTAVVVNGGGCILRRYEEEHGFMKVALSKVSKEECEEAKKRMAAKRSAFLDGLSDITENIKQKIGTLFKGKLG